VWPTRADADTTALVGNLRAEHRAFLPVGAEKAQLHQLMDAEEFLQLGKKAGVTPPLPTLRAGLSVWPRLRRCAFCAPVRGKSYMRGLEMAQFVVRDRDGQPDIEPFRLASAAAGRLHDAGTAAVQTTKRRSSRPSFFDQAVRAPG